MTKAPITYTRGIEPGQRFGRLIAIEHAGHEDFGARKIVWRFRCDCGNEVVVRAESIKSGNAKSCGCLKREATARTGRANRQHELGGTRIWRIWSAMLGRCENPNHSRAEYYGGRGIKVCPEWHDLDCFHAWAMANGYADYLTIDRYPDKDGDYEPTNCRWATWSEQAFNRRPERWRRRPKSQGESAT